MLERAEHNIGDRSCWTRGGARLLIALPSTCLGSLSLKELISYCGDPWAMGTLSWNVSIQFLANLVGLHSSKEEDTDHSQTLILVAAL